MPEPSKTSKNTTTLKNTGLPSDKQSERSKLEKIVYPLLIVVLFIPLTFFAANTIFPQYKDYYDSYKPCYMPEAVKIQVENNDTTFSEVELQRRITDQQIFEKCQAEEEEKRKEYELFKEKYDVYRFFVVLALAIISLLVVLFITLQNEIITGLFIGSVLSTVIGLMTYFDSSSWIALGLLVVVFVGVVWFMNKRK